MAYKEYQSADIARAALRMSLTETRADENALKERLAKDGIRAVAVNFGGKFLDILPKIFESAIVAAQRQKVISDTHVGDGSVVGAMESAIEQVKPMAIGMNVLHRRGKLLLIRICIDDTERREIAITGKDDLIRLMVGDILFFRRDDDRAFIA